jgi:hypothetical protein
VNALPAKRVVDELVDVVTRFRLDLVSVVDDNFLVDRERGVEIAAGLIESGVKFDWCIQNDGQLPASFLSTNMSASCGEAA